MAGFPISIHTVLADCDFTIFGVATTVYYFNPHSPRRLWPSLIRVTRCLSYFNPHSPRRLWHHPLPGVPWFSQNFNPHSPRRLWRVYIYKVLTVVWFQSTQSSQTVTSDLEGDPMLQSISIHTVLADCDSYVRKNGMRWWYFNPHSPRRLWLQLCMIFTIKYNLPSYTMHKSLFILYYIFSRNQILCALFWCESPRHFMFAWDSHHNTCIPFFW